MECKQLNIAILAETKIWLEDYLQNIKIEGYSHFQIRSDENEDKQGGLICYTKNDTTISYEFPIHKIKDDNLQYVQKERRWIISKTFNQTTAVCFIYARCQFNDNRNEEWNQGIYKIVAKEQQEYKDKQFRVLIIRDLNGHIGNGQSTGIKNNKDQINTNGQMIIDFVNQHNYKILNQDKNTKGLWTRQRGGINTVLDYALLSKEYANDFVSMEIDDKGEYPSESDHNWIFVKLKDKFANKPTANIKDKNQKRCGISRKSKAGKSTMKNCCGILIK